MKNFLGTDIWCRIRQFAPVLAVAIVGAAASISVWYLTHASEDRAFVQEFTSRADNQATILQNGLDDYWSKLYAVRALFDASNQPIKREEFEIFGNSLLEGHTAILNIAWIPRIRREERVAHELAAARDGLPDYHIRSLAPDGSLQAASERNEYYPKFYSTEARTSPVYGLDLNDGGTGERTLNHIRDANVLSVSLPMLLYIGAGDRHGFIAGLPVYAHGLPHDTVEDRRRNLLGFVEGVFQIRVMIDEVFSGVEAPIRVYMFAPDATVDDPPIYFGSRLGPGPIQARSQAELVNGRHLLFPINFGDVPWKLVVTPELAGLMSGGHQRSSIVLICGLLLSGGFTLFIGAMRRDAYELKIANDKFESQNVRFDAALNNMARGLLMFGPDEKLVISNQRVARLFGVPWEQWELATLGATVPQLLQLAHDSITVTETAKTQIIAELHSILERRKTGSIVFDRTDGHTFSAECVPMSDGGFVITLDDITERRRSEDKISHMAHHDALTDLPNRVLFYEKMEELLKRAPQSSAFAVLSLDLDHFKSVNDTLGHSIGDKLLQAVAGRMRSCIRETDIVARLSGDEFAILQVKFNQPADATLLATRLIAAVNAPFQLDGHQVVVATSIGIAIAPGDGTDPNQLMKNADLALYRAKANGGSVYRFFEEQMDARMRERHALELDLRKALVNREFTLNYQPIIDLQTGKVTACEALIRWHQPQRGSVPPMKFIPIAEQTGLIVPIGEWVLGRACADAAEWPDGITVAVNASPAQFKNANFFHVVTDALAASGLPASRLELEITELVLMQDDPGTLALLHQFKELGLSIAMDDFGTGYSSLGHLRSFPFDKIKIDQSFVRDLATSKDSLAILRAVAGLGRGLNIVTTAEGIETQRQLDVVRSEGCTQGQGYFFSRPKSAAEVKGLLVSLDRKTRVVA